MANKEYGGKKSAGAGGEVGWGGWGVERIIEACVRCEAEGVTVGRREIKAHNCIITAVDT